MTVSGAGDSPTDGPRALLTAVVGSRAHGTATPASDWDVRSVFLQPTRNLLVLGGYEKYIEAPGVDENSWELFHFLRLGMRNNPFALETLAAPPRESSPEGDELRALFPRFLGRVKVRAAYLGFATGQKKRMLAPDTADARRTKAMSHYLRILFNGIELLRTGSVTIRIVDTEIGPRVLAARRGELTAAEAMEIGEKLEREMEEAFASSRLPDDADPAPINEFHLRVRKANW